SGPGYWVRLVNEAGADVADGEVGELLVDAPSAGEGYWNQRAKSRSTFEGHWTRTGDKYIRDVDGRYTFCGRSDDMFKVSGIWVSPFEVESALITHPAVLEAAVVRIREAAEYGSRLKAGTTSLRMRRLDHFRKAYDMTTLTPSGFLTVGAAHLEYRMIGPSPESAPVIVMLHEGLGSAGLWGDF